MALNDLTQTDLYDLDDSAYRDYSRSRLARARSSANRQQSQAWRGLVDLLIAFFLFMVVAVIVFHERGIL